MTNDFPFIETFSIDADAAGRFATQLIEASEDDWSALAFNTVFFGDVHGCKTESSFLTNGSEPFFGKAGEVGSDIANEIISEMDDHVGDYSAYYDLRISLKSPIYAIRATKVFDSDIWSVEIDGNLMDGLFSWIFCASEEPGSVLFPHLNAKYELNCGQGIIFPGGFPYSPKVSGGQGTIYFKTSFR